jgi:hypothetical protein
MQFDALPECEHPAVRLPPLRLRGGRPTEVA